MILRLTDGTTTVSMTGGPIYRLDYAPEAAKLDTLEYRPGAMMDGGVVAAISRAHVTEACEVTVTADTADELRTALQSLETLLLSAIEFQNRRGGARVYVEFAAEDDDDVYRSEILYGRLEPGRKTLTWWPCAAVQATITWKRRYYWEGPEAELSLSNGHGSGTGGITIYNAEDATYDNYVDIADTDVTGVLPAPIRLEITNTYNVAARLEDIFIGHNVYSDPATLDYILEAEDAYSPAGAGSADSACSGGTYKSTNTITTTAGVAMAWTFSSAQLGHCNGRWFRLLLRTQAAAGVGYYLQPKITFPAGTPTTVMAVGQETQPFWSGKLHDLGVLQIPPWLRGLEADLYPVDLSLYGRKASTTGTIAVDYLELVPLDSYRVLRPRGYGLPLNARVVDDGILGWVWSDGWSGNQRLGHYYGVGQPVHLVPDKDQRLVFVLKSNSSDAEIARTATVRAYYRPRRTAM